MHDTYNPLCVDWDANQVLVLLVAFSSPVVSHIQEMEQSYYHILGIPVNADARAIKKAYKTVRTLALTSSHALVPLSASLTSPAHRPL